MDEGYIKYKAHWSQTEPFSESEIAELRRWRQLLHQEGLIGVYENGIGFGNISQRLAGDQFLITGSATGHFQELDGQHFSIVKTVNLDNNELICTGPRIASSESMSHAVIYRECREVNGVIHIHDLELWKQLLHQVPTTDRSATYGSPEMAYSIMDLLQNSPLKAEKIFVMEGHEEGIFTFGNNLEEAYQVLHQYIAQ